MNLFFERKKIIIWQEKNWHLKYLGDTRIWAKGLLYFSRLRYQWTFLFLPRKNRKKYEREQNSNQKMKLSPNF
jgi:hypothetical protein